MLKKIVSQNEIQTAVDYIGTDYKITPYMYVNLIKYGLGTDNVTSWLDLNEKGEIDGVYLLYYDCLHFYTKNVEEYPVERLLGFIKTTDHKVLMLQGAIGDRIDSNFPSYYSERNYVIDMDKVGLEEREFLSEIAKREDISEIVDLLMADPEYMDVYDRDVLSKQLHDRFDDDFSRYIVVKMDGKVVATCSTYAEVPGFAIISGVIVHPEYRRRGLAADVELYACKILEDDKKSRVGFVNFNNTASLALQKKLGAFDVGVLAKLVKRDEE